MNYFNNDFLTEVEKFTGSILNKKEDLLVIINACKNSNKENIFEDLCFTGKYISGLFRVLRNSTNLNEVKNIDQIKKDFSDNLEKLRSKLQEISLFTEEKEQLEESYIQLSQNSLQNLQNLFEDLDSIKKYLNYIKRNFSD